MSIGANTLDFVRSLFRRYDYERPPINPSNYQGVNSPYFQYGMQTGTMGGIRDQLRLDTDLVSRFVDYEDMDDSPLISAAHDIYAEDATQLDSQESHSLWFKCSDGEIKKDFEDLFYKRLKTEENIWRDVRTLCKYGNGYSEIVAKDRAGVIAENFLAPPTMRRIEVPKEYGNLGYRHDLEQDTLGFIYDDTGTFSMSTHAFFDQLEARIGGRYDQFSPHDPSRNGAVFEGWEVVHTRLLGKNPSSIYGFGVGESARWIFKRLMLLEDSIIMHRITRAPSRFAYYIDVSNIPPQETASYLNRVKQSLKKQKFINPNTGRLDTKFNVASQDEDFFIPTRDGKDSTRIEPINGPIYDAIEDVKFFEAKLFAALKVPRPYLTYEEATGKTHLSAEDARFARTILRVQREYLNGRKKVARVHLAARGINPDAVDFSIHMTIPSAIFELAQLEIRNAELELAEKFGAFAPRYWIMTKILGFSDDEIVEMERMRQREENAGELPPEASAAGSISQAASKATGTKGRSPVESTDAHLFRSVKKNTESLLEKIDELRNNDKRFNGRWSEMNSFFRDLRESMNVRRR